MIASLHRWSFPVLAAGMYLSGFATVFGSYDRLRVVIAVLMSIGSGLGLGLLLTRNGHARIWRVMAAGAVMLLLTLLSLWGATPAAKLNWEVLLVTLVQLSLVCGWIAYCAYAEWDRPELWHTLAIAGWCVTAVNLFLWVQAGFPVPFAGLATAKNALATSAAISGFIAVGSLHWGQRREMRLLGGSLLIASATLLIASGGRSALLAVFLSAVCYWCWPFLLCTRQRQTMALGCVALVATAIPVVYLQLENWRAFATLDRLSHERFGLSLYTGRESLWPQVIDAIREHPVYGNGAHASQRFSRTVKAGHTQDLSAHNLYLATLHQSGIVGLAGLCLLLGTVWRQYYDLSDHWITRLAGVMFLGIVMRENFEVSLTQNNLQMGLGEWAVIASGISPWLDQFAWALNDQYKPTASADCSLVCALTP